MDAVKFPLIMLGEQLIDGEFNFVNSPKLINSMSEYEKFKSEIVEDCVGMWGENCMKAKDCNFKCCDPTSRDYESWVAIQLCDEDRARITVDAMPGITAA